MANTRGWSISIQYAISLGLVSVLIVMSYLFANVIGHRVVALILLLAVSILAMLFDIFPVLMAAVFSALAWNFFFIPPTLTLHIGTPEDALMFMMYFVIALINAVLTFKIRDAEKKTRLKEEREKTIRLYNTLFNSLSHELRTPIATIIGSIDTITESADKLSANNLNELYLQIEHAGLRLNRQVENLLNMSRIEAGVLQPRLDWCDVNELIYSIINVIDKDIYKRSIVFEAYDMLPLFKIDRGLVEQILHNLLHNALHHTPENAGITIQVRHESGFCIFIIEDNGAGFSTDQLDRVFDKFYRLSNSTSGGTGLGLSIVKGFTEAHGGTIQLENIPSGGARFTVYIQAESSTSNLLNDGEA
jgi:two-component system sensor histidine kinase KdpD